MRGLIWYKVTNDAYLQDFYLQNYAYYKWINIKEIVV